MTTTLNVTRNDNAGPVVELLEPPAHRRDVLATTAVAVCVTVVGDGPTAVTRIDVAVECELFDEFNRETVIGMRAAFVAVVPA